jgi:hypothetical protein
MARRNIEEYQRVLSILDSKNYKDNDGGISLSNIEAIFVATTDKVRPETIKAHIDQMCRLKLFIKRGEITYFLADNWKEIIKQFL